MFQLGIRGVSSTAKSGFEAAKAMGSTILSVRKVREMGPKEVAKLIPKDAALYFSIDIDGLDPSIAHGTGTPSHGGFLYYEVKDLVRELISKAQSFAGMDLVEVAPPYDPAGVTATLAARLLLDTIGFANMKKMKEEPKAGAQGKLLEEEEKMQMTEPALVALSKLQEEEEKTMDN